MFLRKMIARQKQITEAARAAGRNLTEEEQQEFDDLQRSIDEALSRSGQGEGDGPGDGAGATQRAVEEERARIQGITELCSRFGMDAGEFISRGDSLDNVREAVLDNLERNGSPISVRVSADEGDKKRSAIVDGILMRNNIHVEKPAAGANDFRGSSLRMIAASCLADENDGATRNYYMMDPSELFDETMRRSYYNPTAAFPAIMDQVVKKLMWRDIEWLRLPLTGSRPRVPCLISRKQTIIMCREASGRF